ncbi:MAG TPA: hypothetical protein VFT06_00330 [Flavisolibacter sp.]|nr:hypothetical protein [Flavisolibacter sp.]
MAIAEMLPSFPFSCLDLLLRKTPPSLPFAFAFSRYKPEEKKCSIACINVMRQSNKKYLKSAAILRTLN